MQIIGYDKLLDIQKCESTFETIRPSRAMKDIIVYDIPRNGDILQKLAIRRNEDGTLRSL